jgi:hypothetical protein
VFVERGGGVAPEDFAALLAENMVQALVRLPKTPVDGAAAGRIQSTRMIYEAKAKVFASPGLDWTVAYDDEVAFPDPVYSRTVFVKPIDDVMDVVPLVRPHHQTIGLAIGGARRLDFANAVSALGVDRFPTIGHMTDFDVPWDGVFEMSRLVRWISLGQPI